jgi:hypothetical protein
MSEDGQVSKGGIDMSTTVLVVSMVVFMPVIGLVVFFLGSNDTVSSIVIVETDVIKVLAPVVEPVKAYRLILLPYNVNFQIKSNMS